MRTQVKAKTAAKGFCQHVGLGLLALLLDPSFLFEAWADSEV